MWPYWMMFILPATAALVERATRPLQPGGAPSRRVWDAGAICTAAAIALLVGLREDVGGDWVAYTKHFDQIQAAPFEEALKLTDPGYALLNWVIAGLGLDIFGVNLICGTIFGISLILFCKSLPRPWLAITVAVPYLVIVVAMGYSRQAVALAFAMLGMRALKKGSPLWFGIWGIFAALFHKSAVLLLPIAALAASRNKYWSIALGVGSTALGYLVLLQDSFDQMYSTYVDAEIQSQGAMIRLLMNAVPSIILLRYSRKFQFTQSERGLWRWFAILSLVMLAGLFFSQASTAIDRMALYLLPLQLVVFANLPEVFGKPRSQNLNMVLCVILYYTAALFTWLNFGNNSYYWVPYRLHLL